MIEKLLPISFERGHADYSRDSRVRINITARVMNLIFVRFHHKLPTRLSSIDSREVVSYVLHLAIYICTLTSYRYGC